MHYPDRLTIVPFEQPVQATIRPPGSKSITNRALVLAALSSRGRAVTLTGALESEDTEVMIESLRRLAYRVDVDWPTERVTVYNPEPHRLIPATKADLFIANSGTSMRFLTAMVSLGQGHYRLDGVPRMRERPIGDLLEALTQIGVNASSEGNNGRPPVVVDADSWKKHAVQVRGDVSSQFATALLLAAPFAREATTITIGGTLVSEPYVGMTIAMLRQFRLALEEAHAGTYVIPGSQAAYLPQYDIEPDASAASYWLALAAITGGSAIVPGIGSSSLQGDVHFAAALRDMGCNVAMSESSIQVDGGPLHGIDIDMNAISDTVMTLAAVACFAKGPTTIRNVRHIRHKETDRLAAIAAELRRIGAQVDEFDDGLTITPADLHGAEIETYNDHRMAMSLALVGTRLPGIVIKNPACVAKTYPRFFQDLEKVR